MKILPVVPPLCFAVLFTVTFAQEPSAEQQQRQIEEQLRRLQSPKSQLGWEADQLASTRSAWNGQGTWMPLSIMLRAGGDAELGLTEEQKMRLAPLYRGEEMGAEAGQRLRTNPTPEWIQAMEMLQAAELPDDPLFERATEEQQNAWREAQTDMISILVGVMQKDVEETLTPEQMLHVRKLEMQLMSEMGIPFPSMFDPLNLTDEQKQEMNLIADEMKAEFDRLTLEEALLKGERLAATYGLLQGKSFASRDEFQKSRRDVLRQYVPSEAMRKKSKDLQEQGTKMTTLLKNRLMNVLTDEQLDKMQKIMDESPEYVKKILAEFKARREAQQKSPDYIPGPDSWHPGDPLPVQFKEQRRVRGFPRSE
jgi:hypothetical protein